MDFDNIYESFQLEFIGISRIINHMTCYKFRALIDWNYNIQTYTYKFQLKTTYKDLGITSKLLHL